MCACWQYVGSIIPVALLLITVRLAGSSYIYQASACEWIVCCWCTEQNSKQVHCSTESHVV
jgi:hypothetical protein